MAYARHLLYATVLLLLTSFQATAQDTGSISGTVTDKSGSAVVGAEVVVSGVGGNLTRNTITNADGAYTTSALPGGSYNLTVTAQGFQKFTAKNIVLDVGQKSRIDVQLTVGAVSQEIVVTGESVEQVETQSSELGGTVTGKQISQLQLNGRDFKQLATLTPGVSNQTGQDEGGVGVTANNSYSVNGGRVEYNNFEVDGGDVLDNGSNNTLNVTPSLDAIAEVKVLTSNYGAQYGRNGSGTIEVETKSGTNSFHGDAYEYLRNDFFNARNFFDPSSDANGNQLGAPPYKKHDYGYTIGGPVFIPGHYNSDKQKTFFFWSQEWRKENTPTTFQNVAVPSIANRSGNFSDLCPGPDCPHDPVTGNPFVNNTVAVDPNAQALLALIPTPNNSNCGGVGSCYQANQGVPLNYRQELVRIDHNFNANWRATFRYIHDSWVQDTATPSWGNVTNSFPVLGWNFVGPGTGTVAKLTGNVTPTLLNEFVFSYTGDHIFLTNFGPGAVARPANSTQGALFNNGFGGKLSGVQLSEAGGAYNGGFASDPGIAPWNNANPTYTLRDNVSKILGNHNFQFGAYVVFAEKNEQNSPDVQGLLNFSSSAAISTGNAFADLLTGNIASFQQWNSQVKYYNRYKIVEPYFNDDWRITKRLTLNLGLRVSLFGTYRERYQQAFNFDPGAFVAANAPTAFNPADGSYLPGNGNPFNGIVQCGGKGGNFAVPGGVSGTVGGNSNPGCLGGHLFNPAPRIGFAWDPQGNGKTAIRGGYGIFFEHSNGNEANSESLEGSAPLVLNPTAFNIVGSNGGQNGCPANSTGYECIGGTGAEFFPVGPTAISPKTIWPYVQQWNLNIQHEFAGHFVAAVAYVGSKGTHLGSERDLNQLRSLANLGVANPYKAGEPITPQIRDAQGNVVYAGDCNTLTTRSGVPVTGQALVNLNIACGNVQSPNPFRPFVGFSGITGLDFLANSSYNALQASLRRSFGALNISANYTYSHSIDNASDRFDNTFVDSYNLNSTRGSSTFDQRHLFTLSYVYDLPFFSHSSGFAHTALGGWTLSGITTAQTGTPFTVKNNSFTDSAGVANTLGFGSFPDVVGDLHSAPNPSACNNGGTSTSAPLLYNPCAFADPRGLTFGDAGRSILRVPSRLNFDSSLLKNFQIKERAHLEFRAEAFNLFNHTQFNGVNNTLGSTNFLEPSGAHRARTLQFGLKFLF